MKGRIPARFATLLFGAIFSAIMVSLVSAVVILVNHGLTADFAERWLRSFLTTWPIALPTVTLLAPVVRRWVSYLTSP